MPQPTKSASGVQSGALSRRTPTVIAVDLPLNVCQQINALPDCKLITIGVPKAMCLI